MFCKSDKRLQLKDKRQPIHLLQAYGPEEKIIQTAHDRNDEEMQRLVDDGKLYEIEFKCHNKCYKDYTRKCYVPKESNDCKFPLVEQFIGKEIIASRKAVSLAKLTEIYGEDKNDCKKRQRLKEKIKEVFPDILFLSANTKSPQTIAQKEEIIKVVASELRKDILNVIENALPLPWPPKPDDLFKKEREAPLSVTTFLRYLLQDSYHKTSESTENLIWSFSQDLLDSVSNGSFLTAKHILVACAIHTMTGQKIPVEILASLGNCPTYYTGLKIETAQAELCQHLAEAKKPLPVQPISSDKSVLTHFWWDNFDCNKDNIQGSVHTSHGVAFQEISSNTTLNNVDEEITPSGRKSLRVIGCALPPVNINPKKPPKGFEKENIDGTVINNERFSEILTLWKLSRRIFGGDKQFIPRFIGRVIKVFKKKDAKTILTFLPPINRPITEFSTVCETIHCSIRLSQFSNMLYTHITVDISAAEKYYKVIWNNLEKFNKVIS